MVGITRCSLHTPRLSRRTTRTRLTPIHLRLTEQHHWRRIAEIIYRVFALAEMIPRLRRCDRHAGADGVVRAEHLHGCLIPFRRVLFLLRQIRCSKTPDIRLAVLAATNNISPAIAHARSDLAAVVLVALKFDLQTLVPEIVKPDAGVVAGDQDLDVAIRAVLCLDPRDLAPFGILAPRGTNVDLRLILQSLRLVEHAQSRKTTRHSEFPIRRKSHGRDHIRELRDIRNALVGNTP